MSTIRLPGVDDQVGRLDPGDWPFLGDDSYMYVWPRYTRELAEKLANADADVAAAVNAATAALAAAGDSGWQPIPTWSNAFSAAAVASWSPLQMRRRFGIGFLCGGFSRPSTWTDGVVMAVLPSTHRPTVMVRGIGCDVLPNGNVVVNSNGGPGAAVASISYPLN